MQWTIGVRFNSLNIIFSSHSDADESFHSDRLFVHVTPGNILPDYVSVLLVDKLSVVSFPKGVRSNWLHVEANKKKN